MKTFLLLASACLGLVVAGGDLLAQGNNSTLTGSWTLTFSPTSPTPTVSPAGGFGGLATFISDGTVVETDTSQTAPSATSNATPPPSTPGHGIWQPGGAVGTFYIRFVSLTPNKSGGVQSRKTVTITGSLDSSTGNVFHGSYNTQVTDPNGNTLSSTAGTVIGQRMLHPLLP